MRPRSGKVKREMCAGYKPFSNTACDLFRKNGKTSCLSLDVLDLLSAPGIICSDRSGEQPGSDELDEAIDARAALKGVSTANRLPLVDFNCIAVCRVWAIYHLVREMVTQGQDKGERPVVGK